MFYIIDRKGYMDGLGKMGDCFISFIPSNRNFHPITQVDKLSLIYIRSLNDPKGYVLCIDHHESLGINQEDVIEFLENNTDRLFVMNKKDSMYYFPKHEKLYDLGFIVGDEFQPNECINFYYRKHESLSILNTIIPLSKHYEDNDLIFNKVSKIIKKYDFSNPQYQHNNFEATKAFFSIESNGVKIDKEKYLEYYKDVSFPEFNICKGRIFGRYNLYTTTGRPSNAFNNINFAALNKTNGIRSTFIHSNDILVEFDFSAYHPRIITDLIDYKFDPNSNVYEQLAKEMFNTKTLTPEQISNCKELTFKQLYGGVYEQYHHVEFFNQIETFTNNCWTQMEQEGYFTTTNRILKKDEVEKPSTLFNYIIQSYETSNNVRIINEVNNYLKDKKTKIVMYTYDAFLFDFSSEDGLSVLREIEKMMVHPVTIKKGKTYNDLIKL